jgi:transcriptional regulator with XRE-family HTH domain
MFLGKRLRFIRKQNNMTQKDLADKLNFERATVTSMENNRIVPTLNTLEILSSLFDVPIYYFLDVTENTKSLQFNIVPREFKDKNDCIEYLSKHEVVIDHLDLPKLNESDLINFCDEIQNYIETLTYKYKR